MATPNETITATLATAAPIAQLAPAPVGFESGFPHIQSIAVPPGWNVVRVDESKERPAPACKFAVDTLQSARCFAGYIIRHVQPTTALYADFNPQDKTLKLLAVLDDHGQNEPRWRRHQAKFAPLASVEWNTWTGRSGRWMSQEEFAEFLEENHGDITQAKAGDVNAIDPGLPSAAQILTLAQHFEMSSEKRFNSKIDTQGGGVRVEYVDTADAASVQKFDIFKRFRLALRVFQGSKTGYPIDVRLKFRPNAGKVTFCYELIRADSVFEAAAQGVMDEVDGILKDALGDAIPMFLGKIG